MKAFVVGKYKKKGALRLTEIPEPELRDDDVLVRVHAAGVNLLDSKIRDGEFKLILPYRPPFVLGHDVAGTIVRAGQKVRRFKAGDEVYARPRDHRAGTFAEFIAMNEADVAIKPKNLSMEEAASIPLVGLTAWQALVEAGKVSPARRSSFRPVPAVWELLRSSSPSISARQLRRQRAQKMLIWSKVSAPTW